MLYVSNMSNVRDPPHSEFFKTYLVRAINKALAYISICLSLTYVSHGHPLFLGHKRVVATVQDHICLTQGDLTGCRTGNGGKLSNS